MNRGLETQVAIEIYPNGKLKSKQLVKKSKDRTFDSNLLRAIEKAEPYPIPDDITVLSQVFEITFRPEDKK